ncbi:hypothetical protein B0T19DRAFT_93437 [Cercophora scortea]|uniref:Uncharacterized protein n=1 Tax=Cercophora scortea TaxID=314031 RepID=A0AAE0IVI7_9PEZI|nr:hypothetical protein B0T19DRAFT_93437 [Cercophora scortea]
MFLALLFFREDGRWSIFTFRCKYGFESKGYIIVREPVFPSFVSAALSRIVIISSRLSHSQHELSFVSQLPGIYLLPTPRFSERFRHPLHVCNPRIQNTTIRSELGEHNPSYRVICSSNEEYCARKDEHEIAERKTWAKRQEKNKKKKRKEKNTYTHPQHACLLQYCRLLPIPIQVGTLYHKNQIHQNFPCYCWREVQVLSSNSFVAAVGICAVFPCRRRWTLVSHIAR